MTQPAIQLMVFRRRGRLFVSPWALSDTGFDALNELIPVESEPDSLLHALEKGERTARAATDRPVASRFPSGTPYWKLAGCDTFEEFVEGATAVVIVRDEGLTELEYEVPDERGGAFVPVDDADQRGLALELGPGTPMTAVADAVLRMFETADRPGT